VDKANILENENTTAEAIHSLNCVLLYFCNKSRLPRKNKNKLRMLTCPRFQIQRNICPRAHRWNRKSAEKSKTFRCKKKTFKECNKWQIPA
jgi:hypothetical protein